MDETLLFELVEQKYIENYREQLEKADKQKTVKTVDDARVNLTKTLDKEQLKLFNDYLYDLTNNYDYLNLMTGTRILNYGIKIGMNLQKAFDEYDEA